MPDPSSGPVPVKADSAPPAASTPDNLGPTVPHLDATVDTPSLAQPAAPAALPAVPGFEVQRVLGRVCLKCLRKEPSKRYPSAAALAEDLGRYRRGDALKLEALALIRRQP